MIVYNKLNKRYKIVKKMKITIEQNKITKIYKNQ